MAAVIIAIQSFTAGCAAWLSAGDGRPAPEAFSIAGTVTNSDGSGGLVDVLFALTPGGDLHLSLAGGVYSFSGLEAGTYTLTPTLAGYSFSPAQQTVTVGPDQSGVDFVATADVVETFSVSGTVTNTAGGAGLAGVTVTASPGGATATSAADGTFTISGLEAGDYSFTASLVGFTFAPPSISATITFDADGLDFAGTAAAPDTFSISGTVTDTAGGAGLGGVTLTLTPGGSTATSGADGTYSFSGLAAGAYTVTPALTDYTFAPASSDVTVGPDASGVDFAGTSTAVQVTYTADIAPIMTQYCTGCHGASSPAAGIPLTTYAEVSSAASMSQTDIQSDAMPLGPNKLTATEKQKFADWISAGKPQ